MKLYALRTCNADMTSYDGFVWPESGPVEAPDWNPKPECGGGLHGLLMGDGDGDLLNWSDDAKWIVVKIIGEHVDLGGAVKFRRGHVVHCGARKSATDMIISLGADPARVVGAFLTGGDRSTVTGGFRATVTGGVGATVTGGRWSTVTGGYRSTVTGGYMAIVTGGFRATVTGGYGSTVTGDDGSIVTGGNSSTVTGGYESTVTGGNGSTVSGGYRSTVTGGDRSTVTGGYMATVSGGDGGILNLYWHDGNRLRLATAYVGEDGIEPNVPYRVVGGRFVRADT